ncbi:hypothetical protein ACWEG1_06070 [Streptomyces bauhiniae]
MKFREKIRAKVKEAVATETIRVHRELEALAPEPLSAVPHLEELARTLADLQRRQPRGPVYLRKAG